MCFLVGSRTKSWKVIKPFIDLLMKLSRQHLSGLLGLVLFAALALALSGCSSLEPENASSKPWDSPEGFQGGNLPGMLTQPR